MEIFTLHHCAMNRDCGGWVSSFVIVCYGYVPGAAIYLSMWFKSRQSRASTAFLLANSRFVPASLPVDRQKQRCESSET